MARIYPVERDADSKTRELLGAVEKKMGMVPNMISTMAQSPTVIQAYLGFAQSLAKGSLSDPLRQEIALAVSEANQCHYCLLATPSSEARWALASPTLSTPGTEQLRTRKPMRRWCSPGKSPKTVVM